MTAVPTLTPDEYHASLRLAGASRGIAKTVMLTRGFSPELISGLVCAGFASVVTDGMRTGRETVETDLVTITDAGRKAIED